MNGSSPRLPPYLRSGAVGATGPRHAAPGTEPPTGTGTHQVVPNRDGEASEEQRGVRLRPFVLTQGRVGDDISEIGLETQVTTRHHRQTGGYDPTVGLPPEMQAIISLCTRPMSVAEVSARLHLHLGVAKILVSDLRAAGHLEVHIADADAPHSPETILRVIRGLRAIS